MNIWLPEARNKPFRPVLQSGEAINRNLRTFITCHERGGTVTKDHTGYSTADLAGSTTPPTWGVGQKGTRIRTDNSTAGEGYITVSNAAVSADVDMTFFIMARVISMAGSTTLFSWSTATNLSNGISLHSSFSSTAFFLYVSNSRKTAFPAYTSDADQWGIIWRHATDTFELYFNGAFVGTGTQAWNGYTNTSLTGNIGATAGGGVSTIPIVDIYQFRHWYGVAHPPSLFQALRNNPWLGVIEPYAIISTISPATVISASAAFALNAPTVAVTGTVEVDVSAAFALSAPVVAVSASVEVDVAVVAGLTTPTVTADLTAEAAVSVAVAMAAPTVSASLAVEIDVSAAFGLAAPSIAITINTGATPAYQLPTVTIVDMEVGFTLRDTVVGIQILDKPDGSRRGHSTQSLRKVIGAQAHRRAN